VDFEGVLMLRHLGLVRALPLLLLTGSLAGEPASTTAGANNRAARQARPIDAASRGGEDPVVLLTPAPLLKFPAPSDSNSPAFWDVVDGVHQLHVFNSGDGRTHMSRGRALTSLGPAQRVICTVCDGRRWLEAVLQDVNGTLYGYYHGEPNRVCDGAGKTAPRIGAARSRDAGYTWEDLGASLCNVPTAAMTRCRTR
jgi:hypothetical protein